MGNIVGVRTDISELKKREAELLEVREKADIEHQRLLDALETLDDGFILFDQDDNVILCNSAFKKMHAPVSDLLERGTSFREGMRAAIDRGVFDIGEQDPEKWLDEAVERRHTQTQSEHLVRFVDGRWVKRKDYQTSTGERVGIRIDVTAMKEREVELEATRDEAIGARERAEWLAAKVENNKKRLETFAATAADWFWAMDAEMKFSYFSESCEQFIGLHPSELIGKSRKEILLRTLDEAEVEAHYRLLEDHQPFRNFIYHIQNAKGEFYWVSTSGTPMFDADGSFEGYLGTARLVDE